LKLSDLAERLACRLVGSGDADIVRVSGIQHAAAGDVTFVANAKYATLLADTRASAVIVAPELAGAGAATASGRPSLLITADPYTAFARALELLVPQPKPAVGIDPLSAIAADVRMGADVSIGPFVSIGPGTAVGRRSIIYPNVVIGPGVRIGEDCVIHSHVSIREQVKIGDRVVLHDGVVVGSDGFGFARQPDGTHLKIPQHASVIIEDDVEIGSNSAIDRPAVGETRISAGTKIDNLVHIAHGVAVGRRVLLAGQVGIAGSSIIEDDVMIAGQTGVVGHIRIGKGAIIGAKSAVTHEVDAGEFVTGHPAIEHQEWRKASVIFRHLPSMKKRVEELEQRIADLEEKLAECLTPKDR